MKKTLLTLALVATAVASYAQGRVTLANDATRIFTLGSAVLAQDAASAGAPIPTAGLASGGLSVLLYAGTTSGSLALQTSVPLTGSNIPSPGRMASKAISLNSIPSGAPAFFQVIIVQTAAPAVANLNGLATAANFDGSLYFGTSGVFTGIPGPTAYNSLLATGAPTQSTWVAQPLVVSAVPEPSSMALAGLGAASLLIFRRRK